MTERGGWILVVDDDEDICEIVKFILEAEGYRVSVAYDGLDAWKQIQSDELPVLIILDWMMPRMDGEQFLIKLRGDRSAETSVIILSGSDAAQKKAEALKVTCCMTKPVEYDDLLAVVRRFAHAHSR